MRVNSDPDGMSVRSPRVSTVPVSSWIRKGRVAEESRKYTTWGKRGTCLITRVLQKLVHINYWQDSPPIHYNYYVQKDEILGMCTCSNTVRVCGRGCACVWAGYVVECVLCVGGVCMCVVCVWLPHISSGWTDIVVLCQHSQHRRSRGRSTAHLCGVCVGVWGCVLYVWKGIASRQVGNLPPSAKAKTITLSIICNLLKIFFLHTSWI